MRIAQLAAVIGGLRLSLHVLSAAVWVGAGQPTARQVLLGVKIAVVVLTGLAAWLHGRAKRPLWLGVWGAVAGVSSVAALGMGVFPAG
ncbi:MAG: hypothetical protein M0Z46_00935 [Actinomycetota bacterium]|jgi:hypothetical protein|nr:hypothetical protein [Actinomycetota bacterium]